MSNLSIAVKAEERHPKRDDLILGMVETGRIDLGDEPDTLLQNAMSSDRR